MPRRKKTAAKVLVSKKVLDKLITLGASHHATSQLLKQTARTVRKKASKKKASKKTAKRRKPRR